MSNGSILISEDIPGDETLTIRALQKGNIDQGTLREDGRVMSNQISFSQWLNKEVRKRGWTQSDLGRAACLNRAVINKLFNGQCQPKHATLQALSCGFDLPIETIYRAAGLLLL